MKQYVNRFNLNHNTRSLGVKLFIAAFSVAATVLIVEFLFFRAFLPLFPLKLHGYLDEGIRTLAQNSKQSVVPQKYIALAGDSYAQGYGDWLLESNPNLNVDFHSAHLIHKLTGKDVITFGASGAGSLQGLVAEPITQYEYINASHIFRIEQPEIILVYFYEGNDLNDNLRDIGMRYLNDHDRKTVYDNAHFRSFISNEVIGQSPRHKAALSFTVLDNFFFTKAVIRILFGQQQANPHNESVISGFNRAIIRGNEVSIPDHLQSPSMELTNDEIKLSIKVFEHSLSFLSSYFPGSKIGIVYIPSPLASYKISSSKVSIQTYEGRDSVYNTADLYTRSNNICAEIAAVAEKHNFSFVDSRSFIRKASSDQLIHGPREWKHFNKLGYTALADAVMALFKNQQFVSGKIVGCE